MQDVAKFFLLSGLVQLIIYLALIPTFVRSNASAKSILLQLLLSVLNAAEPVLPAVLVFVRVYGLLRLRWQGIIVSDTQKMLTAGHLDIMLFDKTGTLTVDQVNSRYLNPLAAKRGTQGQKSALRSHFLSCMEVVHNASNSARGHQLHLYC